MNVARVKQLIGALSTGEEVGKAAEESLALLREVDTSIARSLHPKLCAAALQRGVPADCACAVKKLLHAKGPSSALVFIGSCVTQMKMGVASWMAQEVEGIVFGPALPNLLYLHCSLGTTTGGGQSIFPPDHAHLVGVLCQLPDQLAGCLQEEEEEGVGSALLPQPYYRRVGACMLECMQRLHASLTVHSDATRSAQAAEGVGGIGKDKMACVHFLSSLLGKVALRGHRDALLNVLVPALEERSEGDPLWSTLCRELFLRVPPLAMEGTLEGVLAHTTPSLLPSCPAHRLLGDILLASNRAKFVLTQKLFLHWVPPSPLSSLLSHTLAGYLSSRPTFHPVLLDALVRALGVWSDPSALRHMEHGHRVWLSRLLLLGLACLPRDRLVDRESELQRLVMEGIQAHISSPLEGVREVGMIVGEAYMNALHKSDHALKFDHTPSEEGAELVKLTRPVDDQERELKDLISKRALSSCNPVAVTTPTVVAEKSHTWEGVVHSSVCSDTDSDDEDLVPYEMGEDPDSSVPTPPRYLRACMKALLARDNPSLLQVALQSLESLVRSSSPTSLQEVAVELVKMLLHLSDAYSFDDFSALRLKALVAITACSPSIVAPYLTDQFYAPNFTLGQRVDILEVLSLAATELSLVATPLTSSVHVPPSPTARGRRPWEVLVQERLKAKTRVISKGATTPKAPSTPSRFSPVAGLFFFPLMLRFDSPVNTLDLLGEDCLVLGSLLHTLGVVMHAASHAPLVPKMAVSLMDFVWNLRYHRSTYVRRGVLFALCMTMEVTPSHFLASSSLETAVAETMQWLQDLCVKEPDEECRMLAHSTLQLAMQSFKASTMP